MLSIQGLYWPFASSYKSPCVQCPGDCKNHSAELLILEEFHESLALLQIYENAEALIQFFSVRSLGFKTSAGAKPFKRKEV